MKLRAAIAEHAVEDVAARLFPGGTRDSARGALRRSVVAAREKPPADWELVLKRNPDYVGSKPKHDRIVIQNVQPATQKLNVQSGTAQIALDVSPDDAKNLNSGGTSVIRASLTPSWPVNCTNALSQPRSSHRPSGKVRMSGTK